MNHDHNSAIYEVDLFAFLKKLLLQWKPIILIGFIFGILFAGVIYYRALNSAENDGTRTASTSEDYTVLAEELESKMIASAVSNNNGYTDVSKVNTLLYRIHDLRSQQEYSEHAAIMRIDPYNARTLHITYSVKEDDGSNIAITSLTKNAVCSDELYAVIADAVGLDPTNADIGSLITASSSATITASTSTPSSVTSVDVEQGSIPDAMFVTVIMCNDWDEKAITKAVNEFFYTYDIKYLNKCGGDFISFEAESVSTQFIPSIMVTKQTIFSSIEAEKNTIETAVSKLEGNAAKLLQLRLASEGLRSDGTQTTTNNVAFATKPSLSKKYLLFGFIGGIFVYTAIYMLFFIISPRAGSVMGSGQLSIFPSLGILRSSSPSKRNPFVFSPLIYKLFSKSKTEPETELDNTVSAIDYYCKESDNRTATLISIGDLSDVSYAIAKSLSDKWAKSHDSFLSLVSLEINESERTALYERLSIISGGVIVLLENDRTKLKDADCIYQLLQERDLSILGYISIE